MARGLTVLTTLTALAVTPALADVRSDLSTICAEGSPREVIAFSFDTVYRDRPGPSADSTQYLNWIDEQFSQRVYQPASEAMCALTAIENDVQMAWMLGGLLATLGAPDTKSFDHFTTFLSDRLEMELPVGVSEALFAEISLAQAKAELEIAEIRDAMAIQDQVIAEQERILEQLRAKIAENLAEIERLRADTERLRADTEHLRADTERLREIQEQVLINIAELRRRRSQ